MQMTVKTSSTVSLIFFATFKIVFCTLVTCRHSNTNFSAGSVDQLFSYYYNSHS